MEEELSYGQLSFLTFEAVLQVVCICIFGYWAARSGMLSVQGQKQISRLNVDVFTPCLIFSKLASSLSISALIDIFVVPVLFVLMTCVSYACSRATARFFRLNRAESNFVSAMAVFGNSNSLPVSLTLQLANRLPYLLWPDLPGDNKNDVASRGILYLLVFQQLGQILRWSWGYNNLLAPSALTMDGDANQLIVEDEEAAQESEESPILSPTSDRPSYGLEKRTVSWYFQRYLARPGRSAFKLFLSWMNPPLWAMVFAIIVASVPSIRYEFFECGGFIQHTVTAAVKQLGQVAIPLILVILGASLNPDPSTPPASPRYNRIVVASLVSRMILPAMVMLPVVALSVKYLHISILDDPIFSIVSFLLTIAPPAIQLSQICQIHGIFEKEMAGVLFWGYAILTLPSTIFIVVLSLEVLDWAGVSKV